MNLSLGKQKAKQLLKELQIESSDILIDHLKDICMARGAYVREGKLEGAEARLTLGDQGADTKAIILVNSNDSYESRTRFSIAHELGHLELHKDVKTSISCTEKSLNEWFGKQAYEGREIEANEFASELLLPETFVKPDFKATKPSLNLIESVSNKYQTSLIATARRFIDLTDEACALVFFNDSRVLYHFPSESFKRQGFWITPGKLEFASMAYDAAVDGKNGSHMSSVDATTWIDTTKMPTWKRDKLEESTILEQARYFPKLGFGVSLLWVNDPQLIFSY